MLAQSYLPICPPIYGLHGNYCPMPWRYEGLSWVFYNTTYIHWAAKHQDINWSVRPFIVHKHIHRQAKLTTRCIHCLREEHTNENCPSHTRADTWCQCQWQPASIASLPHPINCSQATLPLHNLVACSTLMLASSAPMAKTGSLATHVSCVVTFTCPTWTSKSGKCQYPYSYPPFIKHAKDQWPLA